MYQYRVFRRIGRAVQRTALAVGVLIAALLAFEAMKLFFYLHRVHPYAAWSYLGVFCIAALYAFFRGLGFLHDHGTLLPDELPAPERARHRDLVARCRFLSLYLKRLSHNVLLTEDEQAKARQAAYDIDDTLGAHPLLEDLARAIAKSEGQTIPALQANLDEEAAAIARDKMAAVVADVIQPPFPVVNALVVFYHQFTLTTSLTGVYVSEPALFEYAIVLRDTWRVMTRGDFIRIGQDLFAGVYANCPPMGKAIEDLGQAISCIWLTQSVATAATLRSRTTRTWHTSEAIASMDARCYDSLSVTRDALINDVLPMLRTAFHHKVPRGADESPVFLSNLVAGITRAVDAVVHGMKATPIEQTVQKNRRPALAEEGDFMPPMVMVRHTSRRRRSGHGKRGGIFGVFRTLSQRLKYGSRYPRN